MRAKSAAAIVLGFLVTGALAAGWLPASAGLLAAPRPDGSKWVRAQPTTLGQGCADAACAGATDYRIRTFVFIHNNSSTSFHLTGFEPLNSSVVVTEAVPT